MAHESLPGFIFDVQAWRGSNAVKRMSFAERGVYLEMMLEQWQRRYLPDDPAMVADAIATTSEQMAEVLAAWTAVRRKFVTASKGGIYNAALERTRQRQRTNYKIRSRAGSIAGKASAAKRQEHKTIDTNDSLTVVDGRQQIREGKGRVVKGRVVEGSTTPSPLKAAFAHYHGRFLERYGAKPEYAGKKDAERFKRLLDKHDIGEVTRRLDAYFDSLDGFVQKSGHTLNLFFDASTQTKLIAQLSGVNLSTTAGHNRAASEEAGRLIDEQFGTGTHHGRRP